MYNRQGNQSQGGLRRPIRVLHLVSTFATKTDTKWLYQLLSRFSTDRFESAIACMYGGGEMMRAFASLGMPTFNLDSPRDVSGRALFRAISLIRQFDAQIVHTHLLRADLYGGLAARLAKVPVVLSTAYALGPYRRDKIRRLDGLLDRLCRLLATDVLAVSHAVRNDLIKRLRWPADRVNVIRTGVTFSDRSGNTHDRQRIREQWKISDSSPLVLTVARLSYEKGINVLIRSAGIVHRKLPAVRFIVVGYGPLAEELKSQIAAAGLNEVVCLAGFRCDIEAILPAADLFVLPSLMEGMPNAILEAYAAGLPVVASSAGGSAEAVEHEISGLLVRPGDAGELASAIIRCLSDEPLRHWLARNGRSWACERFSVDRVVDQYETLYEKLYRKRAGSQQTPTMRRVTRDPVESI